MKRQLTSLFFTLLCCVGLSIAHAQSQSASVTVSAKVVSEALSADESAVQAAILDYVEGLYLVDSTRIERSVHPELHKRGYWLDKKEGGYRDNLDMSYEELVHLAATWNKSGERANANSPKQIEIYEVTDKTASAKLTAEWGMDYFHLAKIEGKWMIMNVLWQSLPEND